MGLSVDDILDGALASSPTSSLGTGPVKPELLGSRNGKSDRATLQEGVENKDGGEASVSFVPAVVPTATSTELDAIVPALPPLDAASEMSKFNHGTKNKDKASKSVPAATGLS